MDINNKIQQALQFLQAGSAEKCEALCCNILAESPRLTEAIYLRGCARFQTGDIAGSVSDLETVHRNHPEHLHAAYYFGRSLVAAGQLSDALTPLRAAMGDAQLEIVSRYELAKCLTLLRRRGEAIEHCRTILAFQPDNVQVRANLASLLERENQLGGAAIEVDKALSLDPTNQTAQMTQATLNRRNGDYTKAAQQFRELASLIEHPINRSIVWNQLGQCEEGAGHWKEAFTAFTESNSILKANHPNATPDPGGTHGLKTLGRIRSWLGTDPIANWQTSAPPDSGGIGFLVGFPRSGTTLLDSMLSAHPDIEVLEEKSLFAGLHQNWSAQGTLEALGDVKSEQIEDARDIYRQEMTRQRQLPERPLVIDKLPLNLAYLFLINRLFPEAPIIFLQRHPLDACVSCFTQSFELEASMAYFLDLDDTAHYYDAVMQVAALSIKQISNPIHILQYENLVSDPEEQLRALVSYLELNWEDSVLEYRDRGEVEIPNTPSYQQVSQPLHTRSIGKWQHYSKQLTPVLPTLQPWAKRLGY